MTFGLTVEKLLVIAVIAAMFIGPARLPAYAATLARSVRRAREFIRSSTDRLKEELGPDLAETDWRSLDPRQYDPRRIIREALLDDAPPPPPQRAAPAADDADDADDADLIAPTEPRERRVA